MAFIKCEPFKRSNLLWDLVDVVEHGDGEDEAGRRWNTVDGRRRRHGHHEAEHGLGWNRTNNTISGTSENKLPPIKLNLKQASSQMAELFQDIQMSSSILNAIAKNAWTGRSVTSHWSPMSQPDGSPISTPISVKLDVA